MVGAGGAGRAEKDTKRLLFRGSGPRRIAFPAEWVRGALVDVWYAGVMIEKKATVKNGAGIHCRPSAVIIKAVAGYAGKIFIDSPDHGSCDLRSVLDLITLGLEKGARLTIRVTGPDEEAMAQKLVELFETVFDFPPR